MSHFEKKLSQEQIFCGRVVDLSVHKVELENGATASREVIKHPGGVAVLALDEQDNILMVRQFRYAVGTELLELPAGKLNIGENPIDCGYRELLEETGYCADNLHLLTEFYPTPAYCSEKIFVYFTDSLTQAKQNLDEGEFLTLELVPYSEALAMVLNGEILDGKTKLGVLTLAAHKNNR